MNIVSMRKISSKWGITYQGFIYLDNQGVWQFRYYGPTTTDPNDPKPDWQLGPLSEFCPVG